MSKFNEGDEVRIIGTQGEVSWLPEYVGRSFTVTAMYDSYVEFVVPGHGNAYVWDTNLELVAAAVPVKVEPQLRYQIYNNDTEALGAAFANREDAEAYLKTINQYEIREQD